MKKTWYNTWLKGLAMMALIALTVPVQGQISSGESPAIPSGDAEIPVDPNVRTGVLPNGMRYYVRANKEPENRAELRLAVNVGSLMEDEDQQGLAHFTEHMAFNGSTHFKKSELVDYLESIGTKFGAHLNAYTSFDETVYMLQVPTDDQKIMDKAFLVLEDWAHGVAFEDEEIDKERGVVIEEWRLGRGPDSRMLYQYLPVIFSGSRYADRLPIGKKEILENFDYETIRRFYQDWYRPELMAVVAVGDFDPDQMEKDIKAKFSAIPASPKEVRAREVYDIPDNDEILVAVVTDEEAAYSMIQFMTKHPNQTTSKVNEYRDLIVQELVTEMVNGRLEEIKNKGNSPFLLSGTYYGNMVRAKSAFTGMGVVNNEKMDEGLSILMTEIERARRHGFIESEMERAKTKLFKRMEKAYKEVDKTASGNLAMEYVQSYLTKEPIPGVEMEFKFYQHYLPTISLEEANKMMKVWLTENNQAVVITGPENDEIDFPTKEEVTQMVKNIRKQDIGPYTEVVDDRPLIASEPDGGSTTDQKVFDEIGVTEMTLSNGVKVVLKPTNYKSDEVLLSAFSPGGASKMGNSTYMSASVSGEVIGSSGIRVFDPATLEKKMAGKVVSVKPYVSDYEEGLYGSCSPDDLETMLQMIYLYFKSPRQDSEAYEGYINQLKAFAAMANSPDNAFRDSVNVIMNQGHFRARPLTEKTISEISLNDVYMSYLDRFMDAGDFTFVFVGNVDPVAAKPMLEKYLGGLPSMNRKESFKDRGMRAPSTTVKKEFKLGIEPKSLVSLHFTGEKDLSPEEEYEMKAMMKVLSIMLRESMREEKGGVYGVRANSSYDIVPTNMYEITIGFGCAPENVAELIATVMKDIETLKNEGASEKNLGKTKETHRRERETDLKENRWWLRTLSKSYERKGEAPSDMDKYLELVEGLTSEDIKKAAQKFFDMDRYVEIVMNPVK